METNNGVDTQNGVIEETMGLPITGKCPDCGEDIAPAKDEAQFNRNMALHKRSAHGYESPRYEQMKADRERAMGRRVPGENTKLQRVPISGIERDDVYGAIVKRKNDKGLVDFIGFFAEHPELAQRFGWPKRRTTISSSVRWWAMNRGLWPHPRKHVSPSTTPEAKARWYQANRLKVLQQKREQRHAAKLREMGVQPNAAPQPGAINPPSLPTAVAIQLDHCPCCGARFYATK